MGYYDKFTLTLICVDVTVCRKDEQHPTFPDYKMLIVSVIARQPGLICFSKNCPDVRLQPSLQNSFFRVICLPVYSIRVSPVLRGAKSEAVK